MEDVFGNLWNNLVEFVPDLIGALIVLLIGWLIARAIKALIVKLLRKTSWDEKVFGAGRKRDTNVLVGNIVYYLIMILVLIAILDVLGMNNVLRPIENMMNEFLAFIPNLIAAFIIGFVGYILAKFVSSLINIGGEFLDKLVAKTGFKDTGKLVNILQTVVFLIIFIPFLIQAMNTLQLEAVSEPANYLLNGFVAIIGDVIVAGIVLFIFIWVGKFVANFLKTIFVNIGVDRAAAKIQIQNMIGNQSLSAIFANLIYFFLVYFGVLTAVSILGLENLEVILHDVLNLLGQILFGLIILGIGNYISLIIYNTMTSSNKNEFIAGVMRWSCLALFLAIALRTMGIANEIVELAFGLTLGAIAVAVALSYGLGGREPAGEHFKEILKKFRSNSSESNKGSNLPPGNDDRGNASGDAFRDKPNRP